MGVVLLLIAPELLAASFDATAEEGSYVLVRGSLEGCPDFPGILAHQKVDAVTELRFLDLLPVPLYRRRAEQIREAIANQIAERSDGEPPKTLQVDILRSNLEFKLVQHEILESYKFLADDPCLHPPPTRGDPPEKDRELRQLSIPSVATRNLSGEIPFDANRLVYGCFQPICTEGR